MNPKIAFILVVFFLIQTTKTKAQFFKDIASEIGLDIVTKNNGIAVADYDNDGDLDLFFTGFYSFDVNDASTWNRLMRNNGNGTFEDVTMEAGFTNQFINTEITASLGEKMGASWGDYDNDGYADLFLTNSRLDQLYHNNGDGTFTDVTKEAGVEGCNICYSGGGMWFDHDRDGYLDLYVSNLKGPNFLFQNKGDGTFSHITLREDVGGTGVTWTSVALDIGKDGFLDIYCANDTQINEFYENRSGLKYNETSRAYRIADEGAGMGITVGDYNNDGFFDLYVTNIFNHQPNPLFKNMGSRRFENVAEELGVENAGWGWGTQFFDYDLDGDEDLAVATGVVSEQYIHDILQEDTPNFLFKNQLQEEGQATFTDVSSASGIQGGIERARGLEVFDYDKDGDLDIVIANVETNPFFFENTTINNEATQPNENNWLQIKLEGTTTNRNAFGTEVKISIGGQSYYRWHHGVSFFSQSIKPIHFGVGSANTIDELQITWLSGEIETYFDIPVNQTINIIEGGQLTNTEDLSTHALPFTMVNNHPNPFTTFTQFDFNLKQSGDFKLTIVNALGQPIYQRHLYNQGTGNLQLFWEGAGVPKGIYFYQAELENYRLLGKVIKK